MQFSLTMFNGTSEEVARLLDLQPRFRDLLFMTIQSAPPAVQLASPPGGKEAMWRKFRAMQTGKLKELLELLIENKGKVTSDQMTARLFMTPAQANGPQGTLNRKARELTGEARFITTSRNGKKLFYLIRPEVLTQLLGDQDGGRSVARGRGDRGRSAAHYAHGGAAA